MRRPFRRGLTLAGFAPLADAVRDAREILVTVTEDRDRSSLVEALPEVAPEQRRAVVKLIRERSLPTGIDTCHQMASLFLDFAAPGDEKLREALLGPRRWGPCT